MEHCPVCDTIDGYMITPFGNVCEYCGWDSQNWPNPEDYPYKAEEKDEDEDEDYE